MSAAQEFLIDIHIGIYFLPLADNVYSVNQLIDATHACKKWYADLKRKSLWEIVGRNHNVVLKHHRTIGVHHLNI